MESNTDIVEANFSSKSKHKPTSHLRNSHPAVTIQWQPNITMTVYKGANLNLAVALAKAVVNHAH